MKISLISSCLNIEELVKQSIGPISSIGRSLVPNTRGRLQIECSGIGVPLTEAEAEATLDGLKAFEHHQLVPSIDLEQLPLVAVQLTRFKCGGVCLGVAMSHAAVDGQSASHFYTEWARLARGEQLEIQPFLDRKLLGDVGRKPHSAAPPPQPPPEFDTPPFLIGESGCKSERKRPPSGLL
ncbi:UNVERIFIED_CONTAM: Hydroxycinnamoyltransferase 2 [Sesamum latifolium]|uniref:Hydroxycinnamoyltransferase 2 n=1 Tax=Sesamum latifolium TaxID=2727402 RepID=A0AAW2T9F3_9LAMI